MQQAASPMTAGVAPIATQNPAQVETSSQVQPHGLL
jgi:hypothetical protein